jgi:TRAP-type C4-dicarboxylate transport system permease small subunit
VNGLRRALSSVDRVVFHAERVILLVSLAMMTLLVSVDVVQRTFSRPTGRTASAILALTGERSPAWQTQVSDVVGPAVFWVLALGACIFATWSARATAAEQKGEPAPAFGKSIAVGALVWAGGAVFVKLVLVLFPSSIPGAQKFALGFMLWCGMIGASLATRSRRHIMIDAVTKKLDEKTGRLFALLGGIAVATFSYFITALGALQVQTQVEDWLSGPGIGVYESVPIPYWVITLAIPVAFGIIATRFLAQGIGDFVFGKPVEAGPDAHGVDLAAIERTTLEEGHGA